MFTVQYGCTTAIPTPESVLQIAKSDLDYTVCLHICPVIILLLCNFNTPDLGVVYSNAFSIETYRFYLTLLRHLRPLKIKCFENAKTPILVWKCWCCVLEYRGTSIHCHCLIGLTIAYRLLICQAPPIWPLRNWKTISTDGRKIFVSPVWCKWSHFMQFTRYTVDRGCFSEKQ